MYIFQLTLTRQRKPWWYLFQRKPTHSNWSSPREHSSLSQSMWSKLIQKSGVTMRTCFGHPVGSIRWMIAKDGVFWRSVWGRWNPCMQKYFREYWRETSPRSCIGKTFAMTEIKVSGCSLCNKLRRPDANIYAVPDGRPLPTLLFSLSASDRIIPEFCNPSSCRWPNFELPPFTGQEDLKATFPLE